MTSLPSAATRTAVALVHHPVLDRAGDVMTTTLTNLDLHDIARSVRTYGLQALYIVHPYASQRSIAERICNHWKAGPGGKRIPDRARALRVVRVVEDLASARAHLSEQTSRPSVLWTTAAVAHGGAVTSYAAARSKLDSPEPSGDEPAVLLTFGTGWGLEHGLLASADVRLEPIAARQDSGFNHLSVRAACAITLDRLFG